VQVQDDARAGRARGGERAPAQRGLDVVGVHDARAGALDGVGDLGRAEPAEQQTARRVAPRERGRVALQDLGLLAQLAADQPRQVLDRPLLPAGDAIAVVQQEDHRGAP
jgi:hypothetical protein